MNWNKELNWIQYGCPVAWLHVPIRVVYCTNKVSLVLTTVSYWCVGGYSTIPKKNIPKKIILIPPSLSRHLYPALSQSRLLFLKPRPSYPMVMVIFYSSNPSLDWQNFLLYTFCIFSQYINSLWMYLVYSSCTGWMVIHYIDGDIDTFDGGILLTGGNKWGGGGEF